MEKNCRETKSPGCSERHLLTYEVSLKERPQRLQKMWNVELCRILFIVCLRAGFLFVEDKFIQDYNVILCLEQSEVAKQVRIMN